MSKQTKGKSLPVKEEEVSMYFSQDSIRQTRAGAKRHAAELKLSTVNLEIIGDEKGSDSVTKSQIKKTRSKKRKEDKNDSTIDCINLEVSSAVTVQKEVKEALVTGTDGEEKLKQGEVGVLPHKSPRRRKRKTDGGKSGEENLIADIEDLVSN